MSERIAEAIEAEKEAIIEEWLKRISAGPMAQRQPRDLLVNQVPVLLDEMIEALRAPDAVGASDEILPEAAAQHGEQRLDLGYGLAELGLEYNDLRQAILAALDRRGVPVNNDSSAALHAAIDRAHRVGVQRFIELQQRRLRALQSDFLARLVHDIRSPLATILTSAELARRSRDSEVAPHLARIERVARRVLLLVESQLATEAALSGELKVRLEPVDLHDLAESLVDVVRARGEAKGLTIENRVPIGLTLVTDRLLLGQVIQNLLDNAVRYTSRGFVRLDAEVHDGHVALAVQDTGSGISPQLQTSLFRMYSRFNRSSNHGIGLAVVATIVEALGGRISVASAPGQGSRFEVLLLIQPEAMAREPVPAH